MSHTRIPAVGQAVVSALLVCAATSPALAGDATMQLPSLVQVIEVRAAREYVAPPLVGVSASPLAGKPRALAVHVPKRANFATETPSADARHVADWAVDSGDNGGLNFVIIDKIEARVFVFDAKGGLRGAAPALLGLAKGDDSVPGIGSKKLSSIPAGERTTPAGRFVASLDRDLHGQEVLWIDYDAAISMHRVVTSNPKERRLQRLGSQQVLDRRISYGCVNVPAKFYDQVVLSAFKGTRGIVYVLPDTRAVREVFASYDVPATSEAMSPAVAAAPLVGAQTR